MRRRAIKKAFLNIEVVDGDQMPWQKAEELRRLIRSVVLRKTKALADAQEKKRRVS